MEIWILDQLVRSDPDPPDLSPVYNVFHSRAVNKWLSSPSGSFEANELLHLKDFGIN